MREKNRSAPERVKGRTDWRRVARFNDAEIEHMAAHDPDNRTTRKQDWAEAFIGAPPLKTPVNAKFDVDVVEWFKSQGHGYQGRMNAVLRRYMEVHRTDRVYNLCIEAIINRRRLIFTYQGFQRVVCPHVLGHGRGRLQLLAFQIGGQSSQPLPQGGIWRCFGLDEIEGARLENGKWRSGESHNKPNSCVTDVHIDVNAKAKQRFDWTTMKWREPAL